MGTVVFCQACSSKVEETPEETEILSEVNESENFTLAEAEPENEKKKKKFSISEFGDTAMNAMLRDFLSVGIVYLVSCIAEYIIYVPILGGGGSYLAFITGNLINMKIPCAMNARDIVGVRTGTAENEIISTLSIATSSLVTIVVLALGVLMLIPLEPFLQNPVFTPAFDNVVPALFGTMAYKYYRKGLKVAWIPLLVMTVLFVLVPSLRGSVSLMIIPAGAIAIGIALRNYMKSKK